MATKADSKATVVILIHGIRTAARWQNRVAAAIEKDTGATVIPLKYGYFDTLRFWCPLGPCRRGPIERLRKQIEGIRAEYPNRRFVIFAHSFGTYAVSRILMENPHFRFDRILLCGSIIPESFDWSRVDNQILAESKREAIINDCGTRDVWPVIAKSFSWGYGASGTYGFGAFNVRDRFHPRTHSEFFEPEFVANYWIPAVRGEPIKFSPGDRHESSSPRWFELLRLPFRWFIPLVIAVPVAWAIQQRAFPPEFCPSGLVQVGLECIDTTKLKSRDELNNRLSNLIIDVNRTLDLKGSELFPLMDTYGVSPTPENWRAIIVSAERLLGILDKGLNDISEYDARFVKSDEGIYFIASDAKILVGENFYKAFAEVKGHFSGRSTLLTEMRSAGDAPDVAKVKAWRSRLEELHAKLSATLDDLKELLTTA